MVHSKFFDLFLRYYSEVEVNILVDIGFKLYAHSYLYMTSFFILELIRI